MDKKNDLPVKNGIKVEDSVTEFEWETEMCV